MKKKIEGAWIVHHANKLNLVSSAPSEFQEISFAGRCGVLLSAIGSTAEANINNEKLGALAKASGINTRLELPAILEELDRQRLISKGNSGVAVLGLTTESVLEHTATIFQEAAPSSLARASLELSEKASELPLVGGTAAEYLGDTYRIAHKDVTVLLESAATIGLVDKETLPDGTDLLFNGNLFRRDDAQKLKAICDSLTTSDMGRFQEANAQLASQGCMALEQLKQVLGEPLFKKLHSIGAYDVNTVANDLGAYSYVTRPAAFSKFSQGSVSDDAFDLAKALVTSLTYGMKKSSAYRGRITMINALMGRLIAGGWVGPATAIGQDYKILELRGVIQTRAEAGGMYSMRLLKRDVGELALKVISQGDVSSESLVNLPGASVTRYIAPEESRVVTRKNSGASMQHSVSTLLDSLRQGKI